MNKKNLSESDICDKFIRPAMVAAGWNGMDQLYREFPLRAGRVVVRGQKAQRDKSTVLRADYALFYKANIPLAVLEAKDNNHAMGAGMVRPSCAVLGFTLLFGYELEKWFGCLLVVAHVAAFVSLLDVGRKLWLVLRNLR